MPSFGEKLKLEREKRKITLEEISASTKIGTRMLQALEGDKFGQLPGGIFNKGFVRAYARVVGLDEDQAVADYLLASGEASPAGPETVAQENARESTARETEQRINRLEAISESPSRPLPWGIFAVILLAVALALSLWSHRRREQEKLGVQLAVVDHPAAANSTAQSSSIPPSSQETATSSATGSRSARQPALVSAPMNSAAAAASAFSDKKSPNSNQKLPTAGGATPSSGEFSVLIQAREQSWVSIIVDGTSSASELLEAGSERTVHGRKQVVVRAGNAGGVDFRLNGKKLDVGGNFGEVKTVTIGPAGLVPSASAPPPAP